MKTGTHTQVPVPMTTKVDILTLRRYYNFMISPNPLSPIIDETNISPVFPAIQPTFIIL